MLVFGSDISNLILMTRAQIRQNISFIVGGGL